MSAATATVLRDYRNLDKIGAEVINASEVYPGEMQMIGSISHATSTSRGRQGRFSGAANQIPWGWPLQRATGNTSANPLVKGEQDAQGKVRKLPVTGLAGDRTDKGQLVYASDGSTWTLTRAALTVPVGFVVDPISATSAWVYTFGVAELALLAMCGLARYTSLIGVVSAGMASGNVATSIIAPHHGKFVSIYGQVIVDATDADVTQTINLEIGGTDVTGGVVTWLFSDAVGAKKSGTAITAANEFHEGDLIDIESVASGPTTSDPGLLALYVEIQLEPGL